MGKLICPPTLRRGGIQMELRRWIGQHYKNKDKGITQMGNTTTQQYNNKIKELPRWKTQQYKIKIKELPKWETQHHNNTT
jgi:hypothetical protein